MAIDLYKNRCSVYEGNEPYIFVSYSHQDIEKVVELIRKLSLEGFRVWYDSGVPAGAEWGEEIAAHLKKSKCVLSLLTPNSVESKHFKREFNYADYLEKDILAVYLKECEPSPGLEMLVVSKQCIKRERCENDDDLLEEIVRSQILLPCLDKKPNAKSEFNTPAPERIPATTSPNKQTSVKIARLRAKAEKGDPQAQADLGLAYEKGDGVTQNWDEATRWYLLAAEQGHNWSQAQLGFCYSNGNGVPQSYTEAANWYRKAAEQGNSSAQSNLGVLYYNGMGVELDEHEAAKWYQLAADQGFYAAQNNLAICYEKGEGVHSRVQLRVPPDRGALPHQPHRRRHQRRGI